MADENEAKSEDKAPVEISTSEKKVPEEMPPTYDEANPLTGGEEPTVKITSNETKIDIGKEKEASQGLTKEELMKYANDPYWVRLRWILFILFWVIWVAMLAASIVIIIYAPKCPSPEPKEWWQKNAMYNVDVKNFDDGTLNGLKDNLDLLVESGVGTVYISSFFQTTGKGTRADVTDYQSVDSQLGSLEDWKALVSALMDRDQKVVIDFIPNHTSEHHAWFEQSASNTGEFADFYVWNRGGGQSSPPDVFSGSWTWNDDRQAWYLHRAGVGYPDLNLENPEVIKELKKVMRFWIDTGVNGFVVNDVDILVDDEAISIVPLLHSFRAVVNLASEETGVPCVLMAETTSDDINNVVNMYGAVDNGGIGNMIQLPLYSQQFADQTSASDLKEALTGFLSKMPDGAWPSFAYSSMGEEGEAMADAMTMLKMLLPGTPMFTPGEELGLDSWNKESVEEQRTAEESHLKVFSSLASKMRHQESILFGEINQNTTFVIDNVFGLTRVKKGNPGYLLLINFGDTEAEVDVSGAKYIPDGIRLMTRSVGAEAEEITRYESTSVPVKPFEGRVFTFVPKYE